MIDALALAKIMLMAQDLHLGDWFGDGPLGLFVLVALAACQSAVAEDVVHAVSGIVKSVDKRTKTMVVKTADGTEHTIEWTDKTTVKGVDASGKAVADVSVDTYDGLKEAPRSRLNTPRRAGRRLRSQ